MKVNRIPVLDWHDDIGRTPVLHGLIEEVVVSREMGQHSYFGINREWIDEDDDVRLKILDEIERLTGERLDKLLVLVSW